MTTTNEKTGLSFLILPLLVLAIVVMLAMISAGGVEPFLYGLGLLKERKQ